MENGPPKWLPDGWTLFRGFGGLSLANWGEIGQKLKRPISLFDQTRRKRVLINWCWNVIVLHHSLDDGTSILNKEGTKKCQLSDLGSWPRFFITVLSSTEDILPFLSLSKRSKASLYSAICSSDNCLAIVLELLKSTQKVLSTVLWGMAALNAV